jgi:hypothetical protein
MDSECRGRRREVGGLICKKKAAQRYRPSRLPEPAIATDFVGHISCRGGEPQPSFKLLFRPRNYPSINGSAKKLAEDLPDDSFVDPREGLDVLHSRMLADLVHGRVGEAEIDHGA